MKNYKRKIIGFIVGMFLLVGIAYAANTFYRANHNTITKISEKSTCVKNTDNTKDAFIPIKTTKEWDTFKSKKPSYLSLTNSCLAVNGRCGSSNGKTFKNKPTSGLCSKGDVDWRDTNGSDGTFNWRCSGKNGGSSDSCYAKKKKDPVNGRCGSSNGKTFKNKPTSGLCSKGDVDWRDTSGSDGTFNWRCSGKNGGSSDSCYAKKEDSGSGFEKGKTHWHLRVPGNGHPNNYHIEVCVKGKCENWYNKKDRESTSLNRLGYKLKRGSLKKTTTSADGKIRKYYGISWEK